MRAAPFSLTSTQPWKATLPIVLTPQMDSLMELSIGKLKSTSHPAIESPDPSDKPLDFTHSALHPLFYKNRFKWRYRNELG
jgi:hypothetical protein